MKMVLRSTDLISKKQIARAAHFFFLLAKKNKFARAARIFVFLCRCFARLQRCLCTTKTSNFLVTHYFYGGIVVCAYPMFCFLCSCSLLFSTGPHLHLDGCSSLAASLSHFLTAALNFHVFLPTKFVSFVFSHSLQFFLCHPLECKHQI